MWHCIWHCMYLLSNMLTASATTTPLSFLSKTLLRTATVLVAMFVIIPIRFCFLCTNGRPHLLSLCAAVVAVVIVAAVGVLLCYRGRWKRQHAKPSSPEKLFWKPSGTVTETADICNQPCDQTGTHVRWATLP